MERQEAIEVIKKNYPHVGVSGTEFETAMRTLIPELKESEDEKMRNFVSNELACLRAIEGKGSDRYEELTNATSWLEKQGEQISVLKDQIESLEAALVAKEEAWKIRMKQGEQKPEIKYVYPKFRVGDVIEPKEPNGYSVPVRVKYIGEGCYQCESDDRNSFTSFAICKEDEYKLVEQKPKFKVGDWVVTPKGVHKIVKKNPMPYNTHQYWTDEGTWFGDGTDAHLWTIQDAKDGDVLIDFCEDLEQPLIFILKKFESVDFGLVKKSDYSSYCFLTANNKQTFKVGNYHHIHNISPATKEQRDLLFSKMKEAGYEWSAGKKELKKIEQKPIQPIFAIGDTIIKKHNSDINNFGRFTITDITGGKYWYNDRIICDISEQNDWELVEQKTAEWNKEDEKRLNSIIEECSFHKDRYKHDIEESAYYTLCEKNVKWLKSLKDRVALQPKQEWTQADKNFMDAAIAFVQQNNSFNYWGGVTKEGVIAFLQSLRPQKQWKPTEEQMNQLEWIAIQNKDNMIGKELMTLYNDLKKLK